MKYLGIDFGLRKIGLALGDDETSLAFPIGNIDGGEGAIAHILKIAEREGTEALVVGLPLPAEHQTRDQLERTKQFVRDLEHESNKLVCVVDEQFTSAEARRLQAEYGSDMPEDALAATVILQAYLDGDRGLTMDNA